MDKLLNKLEKTDYKEEINKKEISEKDINKIKTKFYQTKFTISLKEKNHFLDESIDLIIND